MRVLLSVIFVLGLVLPAGAAGEMDGSAWQVKGRGLFAPQDRVTFWKGHFIRRSSVRNGGKATPYECHFVGQTVIWTAKELDPAGNTRIWQGVYDPEKAVMTVSYRYPTPDGRVESREMRARRYAQKYQKK